MRPGQEPPAQRDYPTRHGVRSDGALPTPRDTAREITAHACAHGLVLFNTLVPDGAPLDVDNRWYVAPRDGRIAVHTRKSLATLFAGLGWQVHHFSDTCHLAHRGKLRFG